MEVIGWDYDPTWPDLTLFDLIWIELNWFDFRCLFSIVRYCMYQITSWWGDLFLSRYLKKIRHPWNASHAIRKIIALVWDYLNPFSPIFQTLSWSATSTESWLDDQSRKLSSNQIQFKCRDLKWRHCDWYSVDSIRCFTVVSRKWKCWNTEYRH